MQDGGGRRSRTCLWKQLDLPKITPKSNCSSNNVPPKSHALVKKIHPVLRQSQLSFNYHFVSPWYSHCVSCPHTIYPSVAIIAESSDTWHLSRAQVFFFGWQVSVGVLKSSLIPSASKKNVRSKLWKWRHVPFNHQWPNFYSEKNDDFLWSPRLKRIHPQRLWLDPKKDASIAEEEDSEDLSHEACGNMNQHGHPKTWG